jgi:hypothetical protein
MRWKGGEERNRARQGGRSHGQVGEHEGDGAGLPRGGRARGQGAGRLQGGLLLTDPQTGIGISITIWETESEREAAVSGGFYDEKIEKFAALLTGTPVRKHYDVSLMV